MGSHKIGKYEHLRAPTNQARVYRTQPISSTTLRMVQTTPIGAREMSPSDHSQVQAVSPSTFA